MQQDLLIEKIKSGDVKAFEQIYILYSESLYGIIYRIVGEEKNSEEVLQDVFLKIWNNASTYKSTKGRFFTWALNIARNAAIDKVRSKDFQNQKLNLKADTFADIIENKSNVSGRLDAIGLQKYLDLMGPFCKKLIDLLFFQGFTQKESAEELQIPIGTVKTRNRNCIDKLRADLRV